MTKIIFFILSFTATATAYGSPVSDIQSWDQFVQIVRTNNVKSIDELLENLPEGFVRGYSLIYRPMALDRHLVSPRRPRVLMFGRYGQFMMTYNSHESGGVASSGDRETIETLEYKDSRVYLREITFDGVTDPLAKNIKVNPQKCTQCHGKDPRGLWDPYNSWAGVYGSISRGGMDFIRLGTPEHQKFLSYLKEKPQNPRYSFLPVLDGKEQKTLSDWSEETDLFRPFNPNTMNNALVVSDGYTTLPNQFVGMFLGEQNFRRLGRKMKELPVNLRKRFQYLIKAFELDEVYDDQSGGVRGKLYACSKRFDEFLKNTNLQAKYNFLQMVEDIDLAIKSDYSRQKSLIELENGGLSLSGAGFDSQDPFDLNIEDRILQYDPLALPLIFNTTDSRLNGSIILTMALRLLGMNDQEANITVNSGRYNFYYGNVSDGNIPAKGLPFKFVKFDESVERFFRTYLPRHFYTDPQIHNMTCDQLIQKSQKAL